MNDPFLIQGPALISFSGGRTSAYMLWRILQAHGGELPPDVVVAFANTGKEREETLRFVHECGSRWGIRVRWLEWRETPEGFEEVGFNSASRSGEPFKALIDKKRALPNWQARWCTGFLKVRTMLSFMSSLGFPPGSYAEVVGLRADEPGRIGDMVERNERDGRSCTAPLGKARIRKADVMAFWREHPFNLQLRDGEGNCDLCFLKGAGLLRGLISKNPSSAAWWIERENEAGATFSKRQSVTTLARQARSQRHFFGNLSADEFDAECGLWCAGDAA